MFNAILLCEEAALTNKLKINQIDLPLIDQDLKSIQLILPTTKSPIQGYTRRDLKINEERETMASIMRTRIRLK